MSKEMINGLALCSGIGGFELGLRLALGRKYRCICHVERDAFAAAKLVARMADKALDQAPIWDDIKTFKGKAWRQKVDIITAGYPCQPFSTAGKRKGKKDPRHLWPYIKKIIRKVGPSFVFLENVPGHIQMGLDQVIGDLADIGFNAEWDVFSAEQAGAPHFRERLFILAWNNKTKARLLADTYGNLSAGGMFHLNSPYKSFSQRRNNPWSIKCSVDRVAYGIPRELDRERCLGNAVVPAVASLAFKSLIKRVM